MTGEVIRASAFVGLALAGNLLVTACSNENEGDHQQAIHPDGEQYSCSHLRLSDVGRVVISFTGPGESRAKPDTINVTEIIQGRKNPFRESQLGKELKGPTPNRYTATFTRPPGFITQINVTATKSKQTVNCGGKMSHGTDN